MTADDLFIDVPLDTFVERPVKPYTTGHEVRPESKHVTYSDIESRCTARRCNSPTYMKIGGAPKCYPHAVFHLCRIINRLEGNEDE